MSRVSLFLFFAAITILGAVLIVSSCKKEVDEEPPDTGNETKIPVTTKIISDADWNAAFIEVDTSDHTFKFNNTLGLLVGDVLVSSVDGGYLRRVTAINQQDAVFVISTEFASITDAIEQGGGSVESVLTVNQNYKQGFFLADGVTVNDQMLKESNNTNLYLDIDAVLYDHDGNPVTKYDQVKIQGLYGTSTTLKADVQVKYFNLKLLEISPAVSNEKSIMLSCTMPGLEISREKKIAEIPFNELEISAGIPIIIQPVLKLYAGVDFEVGGVVEVGASETLDFSTSLIYKDGDWTTSNTVEESYDYQSPSLNKALKASFYIKPILLFKVYNVVSPTIDVELFAELEAGTKNIDWTLSEGIKADIGIGMDIWEMPSADFIFKVLDVEYDIADGTIGGGSNDPPDASFEVTPGSGSTKTIFNFDASSSTDPEDSTSKLDVKWDFDGDGDWDTDWSVNKIENHQYNSEGVYTPKLLVRDTEGLVDFEVKSVIVDDGGGGGTGQPCPGTETIEYEGQVYNTVLIGYQCWMKENLNYETGNSWCYDNDNSNCEIYGRLYDWETIMNGELSSNTVPSGVQGICPDGWHIPSDEEWKIMEGIVDSQFGVGSNEWGNDEWRGFDVGQKLKTTSGWLQNNGTDAFDFSAFPGGFRVHNGAFEYAGMRAYFWTSTKYNDYYIWSRQLIYSLDESYRGFTPRQSGYSLRCLKD